jgi:large subunit ribosomal protein L21
MYAIVEVGAKQYNIKVGDSFNVEKQDAEKGETIVLDKVLLVAKDDLVEIGMPYVKKALVKAEVIGDLKGKKVISYKYRRRKSSDWKKGHRQKYTRIEIKEIAL